MAFDIIKPLIIIIEERKQITAPSDYKVFIKGDTATWEIGKSPEEALGRFILSNQSLVPRIDHIIHANSALDIRYTEKYWLDTELRKRLPGFSINVKFDNHTPIQHKGQKCLIEDLEGFRIYHRSLTADEYTNFLAMVVGHGYIAFLPVGEKIEPDFTLVIPLDKK